MGWVSSAEKEYNAALEARLKGLQKYLDGLTRVDHDLVRLFIGADEHEKKIRQGVMQSSQGIIDMDAKMNAIIAHFRMDVISIASNPMGMRRIASSQSYTSLPQSQPRKRSDSFFDWPFSLQRRNTEASVISDDGSKVSQSKNSRIRPPSSPSKISAGATVLSTTSCEEASGSIMSAQSAHGRVTPMDVVTEILMERKRELLGRVVVQNYDQDHHPKSKTITRTVPIMDPKIMAALEDVALLAKMHIRGLPKALEPGIVVPVHHVFPEPPCFRHELLTPSSEEATGLTLQGGLQVDAPNGDGDGGSSFLPAPSLDPAEVQARLRF